MDMENDKPVITPWGPATAQDMANQRRKMVRFLVCRTAVLSGVSRSCLLATRRIVDHLVTLGIEEDDAKLALAELLREVDSGCE